MEREYTKEEKLSKLFAVVLQLEEHQRIMQSRLSELACFKMAVRPKNLVDLLQSERRDMDADIAWAKDVLNAAEPDNSPIHRFGTLVPIENAFVRVSKLRPPQNLPYETA